MDDRRAAGARLKLAIHEAEPRAGVTSDVQLGLRAHVHYDTLMNWFSGRTVPRPAAVREVARVLDVPFSDLMAAYDGREPDPLPLQDAIRELIVELREDRQAEAAERQAIRDLLRDTMRAIAVLVAAGGVGDQLGRGGG